MGLLDQLRACAARGCKDCIYVLTRMALNPELAGVYGIANPVDAAAQMAVDEGPERA